MSIQLTKSRIPAGDVGFEIVRSHSPNISLGSSAVLGLCFFLASTLGGLKKRVAKLYSLCWRHGLCDFNKDVWARPSDGGLGQGLDSRSKDDPRSVLNKIMFTDSVTFRVILRLSLEVTPTHHASVLENNNHQLAPDTLIY